MTLGDETWKWALVLVLLSVFVVVANQAYKAVNNPDDHFAPPDDWSKGDSFDQEKGGSGPATGPGAGQPMDVPATVPIPSAGGTPEALPASAPVTHEPEPDWNQIKDPSKDG